MDIELLNDYMETLTKFIEKFEKDRSEDSDFIVNEILIHKMKIFSKIGLTTKKRIVINK